MFFLLHYHIIKKEIDSNNYVEKMAILTKTKYLCYLIPHLADLITRWLALRGTGK